MLARIQRELTRFYDLDVECSVTDFVCDAATARAAHGRVPDRREALYVAEDAGDVLMSLYVAPSVLDALPIEGNPVQGARAFEAMCVATEGVSHFLYVVFRAQNGLAVTELELELQAEIDKYVLALERDFSVRPSSAELLRGNGLGLVLERSRALRYRLFDAVGYVDAAGTEAGDRYRTANTVAARYTRSLESRYVQRGDLDGLRTELRRFYRQGLSEKLRGDDLQRFSGPT